MSVVAHRWLVRAVAAVAVALAVTPAVLRTLIPGPPTPAYALAGLACLTGALVLALVARHVLPALRRPQGEPVFGVYVIDPATVPHRVVRGAYRAAELACRPDHIPAAIEAPAYGLPAPRRGGAAA